jgi:hypothetical protein
MIQELLKRERLKIMEIKAEPREPAKSKIQLEMTWLMSSIE